MSSSKSKKTKTEVIRSTISSYMKQRNYMERVRKSDLNQLSQTSEQMLMSTTIKEDLSRSNSFLYSNVTCLNKNPTLVDQQFGKFSNFVKKQQNSIKKELSRVLPPMFCHLYIEMLKGVDWHPARDFLKKYATILGQIDVPHQGPKLNGTIEDASHQPAPIVFVRDIDEVENQVNSEFGERESFRQLIQALSTIVRIDEIENDAAISNFRACRYQFKLSTRSLNALKHFLTKFGHIVILQILQIWFSFEVIDEQDHISDLDDSVDDELRNNISFYDLRVRANKINLQKVKKVNGSNCESSNVYHIKSEPFFSGSTDDSSIKIEDGADLEQDSMFSISQQRLDGLKKCIESTAKYNLPARVFKIHNTDNRLTSCHIDPFGCHMVAGFENSSVVLWSLSRSTQYGRKPYMTADVKLCDFEITNCDREMEDDSSESDGDDVPKGASSIFYKPKFCRTNSKRERWKEFMKKRCIENTFSESGGITLRGHGNAVTDVLFSQSNSLLFSVSRDLTMRAWKGSDYSCAAVYRGHNYPIWCVTESPTGQYLATGSRDATARLWTVDRLHPLRIFVGHTQDVDSIAFHPNGNYLATASTDLTIRLWCVVSGKVFRIFTDCRMPTHTICFSPDGKFLAAAGEETRIRVFDLAAGSQVGEFRSHSATVRNLTWRPDGKQLVSCCVDGTVRIWDTSNLGVEQSASKSSASTSNKTTPNSTTSSKYDSRNDTTNNISASNTSNSVGATASSSTSGRPGVPTSSSSNNKSASGSSSLVSSFGTGCKKVFRVQYNADNTLSCVGSA